MIEVLEYDDVWVAHFEQLKALYVGTMSDRAVPVIGIEHVGSTSVPGLAAKPLIDVDIVVTQDNVLAAGRALETIGFEPLGELGIPQRWAFRAPNHLPRTNTYVIVLGSLALRNHLAIRDTLRADETLHEEYADVKRRVGATARDLDEYGRGKSSTIQKILTAAGLTDAERAEIDSNQVPPGAGLR